MKNFHKILNHYQMQFQWFKPWSVIGYRLNLCELELKESQNNELIKKIQERDYEVLKWLKKTPWNEKRWFDGHHELIQEAAEQGTTELFELTQKSQGGWWILKNGGKFNTPLKAACEKGHLDILKCYKKAGYDFSRINDFNKEYEEYMLASSYNYNVAPPVKTIYPLLSACIGRQRHVVQWLIEQGSPVNEEIKGLTPLIIAIKNHDLDILTDLLKHGALLTEQQEWGLSSWEWIHKPEYLDCLKRYEDFKAAVENQDTFKKVIQPVENPTKEERKIKRL